MPARIFISYRRDDVAGDARGLRDGLAARFGRGSVFMDVDDLLAGQRFDEELAKALDACDVLIAVIGPRWMDLLWAKMSSGEPDYVRAEIAEALRRRIVVIPVRAGREGQMPALPRPEELPEDLRDLVLHQKHDVTHERFGRDLAELAEAISIVRRSKRPAIDSKAAISTGAIGTIVLIAFSVLVYIGNQPALRIPNQPAPWLLPPSPPKNTVKRYTVLDKNAEERLRVKLTEMRQRFPEYRDLNDEMLLGALHKRFYSDMTWSEFNLRLIESVKEPQIKVYHTLPRRCRTVTSHPHALAIEPPSRGPEGGYLKVVTDLPLYEESPGFDLEAVDSLCDWIGDYLAAYYPSIREARIVRVRKSPA